MSTSISLLAEGFRQAVEEWLGNLKANNIPFRVTSTRRSRAEQTVLFQRFERGESDLPAARPGTSTHELGRAIDVVFESDEDTLDAADLAADLEIVWAGDRDPVHFEDGILSDAPALQDRIVSGSETTSFLESAISKVKAHFRETEPLGVPDIVDIGQRALCFFGIGCKR